MKSESSAGFGFPDASASLFPSGKSLHTICYLTGGLLPALPAPPRALTTSSRAKKWCATSLSAGRHTHTGTNTHTRKLLHSFLHSFPVMEGFCASRPRGAQICFSGRGGSAEGNRYRLLPPFYLVNQWENITQSSKTKPRVSPFPFSCIIPVFGDGTEVFLGSSTGSDGAESAAQTVFYSK